MTKPRQKRRQQMEETKSMNVIAKTLEKLTAEELARVVKWIADKYGPKQ